MRDYLLFYINGKAQRVYGTNALQSLSSYLRNELGKTGTKVVCEEGDCGACTVLLGKDRGGELAYKAVNSCIQYLYQLDLCHIVSIEGLKDGTELNAVQQAMVDCHGAQCGYCTPGFVVSMCGLFMDSSSARDNKAVSEQELKDALTGNLCRCTGYEPILKAGLAVDKTKLESLHTRYPSKDILQDFQAHAKSAVLITAGATKVFIPATLKEAVEYKAINNAVSIISGGTDFCVNVNKRNFAPQDIMSLSNINGLDKLELKNGLLSVGAKVSLAELEDFVRDLVPEFHQILWVFGAPQIKHAATLAGNIANASPIADTPPFLFVVGAQIELAGPESTRIVDIDKFYLGYKKIDLRSDEIISRILIPVGRLKEQGEKLKLYKMSRRKHLDISSFTAAFRLSLERDKITSIAIAYGGVAAVVMRMPKLEAYLQGKSLSLDTIEKAAEIAAAEISPISDVRGSREFRLQLAKNVLYKLYFDLAAEEKSLCPS